MGKLILSEFITIDGVIEAPGGEPGFKYTGWSAEYFNDEYLQFKLDELSKAGSLLLGRKTYEGFAAAWPSRTDEMGFADKMNSLPKFVVSTTLDKSDWNNSILIKENIIEEIVKLKIQSEQDIMIFGSGTLIQTLLQHDLIDEYRLMIHPTIMGTGNRLYSNIGGRKKLQLIDTKIFNTGTVVLIYQPEK
ncbi:dihydrofolate reductase [Chitinophaga niastensis]|uniref:Dihydrofolate reductase n=1 Tax=Chitinophaga niastensis TaxID=536980 RepID=A0A2P8HEV8_CHINA|nr:dihydrofolate reductase family protein [Chitinophaga niastensis]PSL44735.1 dihydrofolate reductase [Chitinophaga niastensis]